MRTLLALLLMTSAAQAADHGYFSCFHFNLDARQWFSRGEPAACCNIADAMATRYEDRGDGVYVPPYTETIVEARMCGDGKLPDSSQFGPDHSHWIRVPNDAIKKNGNQAGIAVIWWTPLPGNGEDDQHTVKCFIDVARS